jgi:sulfur carrier protein
MIINGKKSDLTVPISVNQMLVELEIDPVLVVVELNESIICRDDFLIKNVDKGDKIEIVSFVGGG